MVGTTVGRFEVQRELASSALGSIYQARDPQTGRLLALRTVRLDTPAGRAYEPRLREQAQAASVLNSPNIATVFGGGMATGFFVVATEYVEGTSLRTLLARGERSSLSELIDLARQVCCGLDHAHHHGLFHADLHPGNILIELDGTAKIMDFGIPKDIDFTAADERLAYFAPEQIKGAPPDARSNLFSWGVMLYQLATGTNPFAGSDAEVVRREIQEKTPPPPHELNAGIPAGISRAIMKALAKEPGERYASGKDLVAALENYRETEKPLVTAPAPQVAAPLKRPEAASSAYAAMPPLPPGATSVLPRTEPAPPSTSLASTPPAAVEPPPATLPPGALGTVYSPPEEQPAPPPKPPRVDLARATTEVKRAVQQAAGALAKPETDAALKRSLRYAVPSMAVLTLVLLGLAAYYYIAGRMEAVASAQPTPAVATTAPPSPAAPATAPTAAPDDLSTPEPEAPEPVALSAKPALVKSNRRKAAGSPIALAAPVVTTGELAINSIPDDALIQIDGKSDPGWRTPFLASVSPGPHTVALSKPGYTSQAQTVQVEPGRRTSFAASLNELGATVAVTSQPAGATVLVDGKERGATPAQLVLSRGTHVLTVRKLGYFDFATETQLTAGQAVTVNAPLKLMGNVDDVKSAGKFDKLLRRNRALAALQIRTQPKGARIAINQRIMDKNTPAEFLLPAGNYEIVLTYPGYQPLRKMVTVDGSEKMVLDESLVAR